MPHGRMALPQRLRMEELTEQHASWIPAQIGDEGRDFLRVKEAGRIVIEMPPVSELAVQRFAGLFRGRFLSGFASQLGLERASALGGEVADLVLSQGDAKQRAQRL